MIKRRAKKSEINLNTKKSSGKGNIKQQKFPSISRTITEGLLHFVQKEKLVLSATTLGLLLFTAVVLASFQLYQSLQAQKQVVKEREDVQRALSFWRQVVHTHPDYRDGYFMLAVLEHRLAQDKKSREDLQKALDIDPNFTEGRELERILQGK